MDGGVPAPEASGEVTENIAGTPSFSISSEAPDPMRSSIEPKPAPEGVPAKFWDGDKGALRTDELLKSYSELEKALGGKSKEAVEEVVEEAVEEVSEEAVEESAEEASEEAAEEVSEEAAAADLTEAVEAARTVYAESGELPVEAREPFLKAGISNEQIDLYLQGVKAYENGLRTAAMKAANVEDYGEIEKAIEWAGTNWSEKKVTAFNSQSGDPETVGLAITALFADYRVAEPGEGRLANVGSGANRGDVYTDREAFNQDLQKADEARDRVARKAAVAKLDRSIKAGSLKK